MFSIETIINDLDNYTLPQNSHFFLFITDQNQVVHSFGSALLDDGQKYKIAEVLLKFPIATIIPALLKTKDMRLDRYNTFDLLEQYNGLFSCINQSICKSLAKLWIKIIDPTKQATHPYKIAKKPDWWPKNVDHIEPDHLLKNQRIELLISIIRNPRFSLIELQKFTTISSYSLAIQRLIHEIFYIAVYDRLFFYWFEDVDNLINMVPTSDIVALARDFAVIKVSEVTANRNLKRLTKIEESDLNHDIFLLNNTEQLNYKMSRAMNLNSRLKLN